MDAKQKETLMGDGIHPLASQLATQLALQLAEDYVLMCIDSECVPKDADGQSWLDLDSDGELDLKAQIEFAETMGLLTHHPTRPNLVQIPARRPVHAT